MKIGIRLIGTVPGKPNVLHFLEESRDGVPAGALRTVWDYLSQNATVLGLAYSLAGGTVVLKADNDQLQKPVVEDIRKTAQAALAQV